MLHEELRLVLQPLEDKNSSKIKAEKVLGNKNYQVPR